PPPPTAFERRPRRFKTRRRHAGRRPKVELERRAPAVANHMVHTRKPEDVGNLMWVGYRRDRAVHDGPSREFGGWQQRALDMDVRIDKPRGDHLLLPHPVVGRDASDASPAPFNHSRKNPTPVEIDDLAREVLHTVFHWP